MFERIDGSFNDIFDAKDLWERYNEERENIRSIHFGTVEELTENRTKNSYTSENESISLSDLQEQIDNLTARLDALKPVQSKYIHIPTQKERQITESQSFYYRQNIGLIDPKLPLIKTAQS